MICAFNCPCGHKRIVMTMGFDYIRHAPVAGDQPEPSSDFDPAPNPSVARWAKSW